jgi:propionyl-CoA synthetase
MALDRPSQTAERRHSLADPDWFWGNAAALVSWDREPSRALSENATWFANGRLSPCYNAVDPHVESGRGDQLALAYDSPVTGTIERLTYAQLQTETAAATGALAALGVQPGDRVLLYLPMIPAAVIAMLACARLGAIHVVVFGGFAPAELATRIAHTKPAVIVTASCGIEAGRIIDYKSLLDEARRRARTTAPVVVVQRPQHPVELHDGERDWSELVASAAPTPPRSMAATDPLYVLHTSGTTGKPKGIVRDNDGHAVALSYSMRAVFDVSPGDVVWAASDVGWVVGHSYIVYGPLLCGATTVLYKGKPVDTLDAGAFWRVIAEHGVNILFTVPTAIRAIRQSDPAGEQARRGGLPLLRGIFLAGERTDPDTHAWLRDLHGIPVIDNWWQTETGWPIAAACLGLTSREPCAGSPTEAVPGYDVAVLGLDGVPVPDGEHGAITVRLPLPPGSLAGLWGDPDGKRATYLSEFPGYYATGDGGFVDVDGFLYVMGRLDDVINIAGHRLSTGDLEASVARHPAVAECAVVWVRDDLKGQVPVVLAVLQHGVDTTEDHAGALRQAIRDDVGSIATPQAVHVVDRLPKTRSGKILRAASRDLADGRPVRGADTIEDATVLEQLRPLLAAGSPHD